MSTKCHLRKHLLALLTAPALLAQTEPSATGQSADKKNDDVLVLSKFEVNRSRDVGYFSSDTTSGTRINTATTDVPGSINIINSQFISDLKATAASELVKYTSGVVQNEHTRDDYIVRGFRQSRIFRDGIECTDFVSNQLYDVDRLEVVKGPVAMVFGNSGVLGGAINYVPRKPTSTPQGDLSFAVGAENSYLRSTLNLSGPLSADRKDVRYRLTVGGQNDSREKDIERLNQLFVGGALDMDFGKTTVSLYGYYINNDRFIYFNDFLDITKTSGDLTLNPRSTREFGPADGKQDLYFDSKELYLTATVLTQLSDNLSFRAFYRYRSDDEPRRIIRGISVAADNTTLNRQILNFPYSEFGQATQVDMTYHLNAAGVVQDISWGADYSNVFSRDVLAIYPITPLNTATLDYSADAALQDQYTINNQNQRTTTEQLSYYIQDFASMWGGKVNLVAGLRWINPRITQRNLLTSVNSIRDDPLKQVHRYGVVFKPLPRVSVYAMQANTFQINTGVNHLGNPLVPSEGKITEVGFKTFDLPFAGGHVFLSGAYFDMALTNVVTVGPLTVVNGQTVNEILQVASDTSKGYEFDLGYSRKVGPGTFDTILASYNAKPKAATGLRTIRAPKYDYSFFFKYRFDEGALKGFAFGLGGSFVGNRLATTNGLFYYPAHETYDAFLQYALDRRWSFSLNVANLTNTRYVATYAATGLAGANDGRTIRLSARYAW